MQLNQLAGASPGSKMFVNTCFLMMWLGRCQHDRTVPCTFVPMNNKDNVVKNTF